MAMVNDRLIMNLSRFFSECFRVSLSAMAVNSSSNEPLIIGINLSDTIYDDENGISMESAVW